MHIVTKILVVFGVVLALLLSALVISYASSADNIASSFKAERDAKLAITSELGSVQAELAERRSALAIAKEGSDNAKADLIKEINSLQTERATLLGRVKEAELAAESIKNQISGLGETAKTNATLIKSLTDETSGLRKAQLDATKRETELVDRLNDLESQRQVLQQTTRALQEQLGEAKLSLETAKSGTTASAGSTLASIESIGPRLVGRVTKLEKLPSGEDLIEINIGSAAGVRENQKLNIVRNGQFLGSLIVTKMDLQKAVGRIDRLGLKTEINVDDMVLSRLD